MHKFIFSLLLVYALAFPVQGFCASENDYTIEWKMVKNKNIHYKGSSFSIKARSESEAIAKALKKIKTSHKSKFNSGYELSSIIAIPRQ